MVEFKKIRDVFAYSEMDPWWAVLGDISQDLERLEIGLAEMRERRERLEVAGMYPAVPTESWETRNGSETKYLRMVFGRDRPAGWSRKKYVGCKPEAILEARRLASNREKWKRLDREVGALERFLLNMRVNLSQTADRLARYRLSEDLGTVGADQVDRSVPKEEGG